MTRTGLSLGGDPTQLDTVQLPLDKMAITMVVVASHIPRMRREPLSNIALSHGQKARATMVRNILLTLLVVLLNACGVSSALQQLEVATATSTTVPSTHPATVRIDPAARARIEAAQQQVAAAQTQVYQTEQAALTAEQLDSEAAALDARLGTILSDAQQPQTATVNGGVAASDLPRTDVKHFPVWFVGLDGMQGDRQAGACVGPNAWKSRVENMSPEEREMWCRWWSPQLSNNGSQPINNREDRPGTANGRQADILIPLTAEWAHAVVTLYGRTDQGDWHYVNQRFVTERDPGASVNAMDLLDTTVHNLLPSSGGLPRRAVANRGHHGRSHGNSRRHARRSCRRACR